MTDDTLITLAALRHHGAGSGLLTFIIHAAIWSGVRRVIDRLPFGVVLVLVAVAVLLGLAGWVRGRRRRVSP